MPNAAMSVALSAIGVFFFSSMTPPLSAALQSITPNQMRSQISVLCVSVPVIIGMGLGPTVVALFTDFLFRSEKLLGLSMSLGAMTLGPLSALIICFSVKPYGRRIAQMKESL
jgi:hypothetical protein